MSNILLIIVYGSIISLIGTMIGASLGVMVKKPSDRLLGAVIGFAGGLMLSIVVFDLIPEALDKWDLKSTLFFCACGIITIIILDNKISSNSTDKNLKVATAAAIALMIHNLPEGVIMGCGFAAGGTLGLKMSLVIAIHDIPEGIAVAAPLMASKVKPYKILWYAFVTAFPTAIGSWFGAYIGNISPKVLCGSLAFASGIMLYVVCGEMIPESSRLWDGVTSTIGTLIGVILGLIMTVVI